MKVAIVGFPSDLGAGRRGVDMGPSALRIAGITESLGQLGYTVVDYGDVSIQVAEVQKIEDPRQRYKTEILRSSEILAQKVYTVLKEEAVPVLLGGDHSMSIGSIAGVAAYCREMGLSFGVLWIDAHPDMNTPETTPSGNIHGMPLAIGLGYGDQGFTHLLGFAPKIPPENVALIGIRAVDPGERDLIRNLQIRTYTMHEIDREGIHTVVSEAIDYLINRVDFLHVSFDLDSVDPSIAPGVGTPVPGGLTYRETHYLMERIAATGKVRSIDIVEINPVLDIRNKSAQLAVAFLSSCMGKRIL